jgi:hypothetical protein
VVVLCGGSGFPGLQNGSRCRLNMEEQKHLAMPKNKGTEDMIPGPFNATELSYV